MLIPAEVFSEAGAHYVHAGAQNGLAVGVEYPVVGAGGPKRHRIGTATVLQVMGPKLARISLDDEARAAGGKRFLSLPDAPVLPPSHAEAPPPPPPPATTPPAPKAPTPLQGRATTAGFGPLRVISVFNSDNRSWRNCRERIRHK